MDARSEAHVGEFLVESPINSNGYSGVLHSGALFRRRPGRAKKSCFLSLLGNVMTISPAEGQPCSASLQIFHASVALSEGGQMPMLRVSSPYAQMRKLKLKGSSKQLQQQPQHQQLKSGLGGSLKKLPSLPKPKADRRKRRGTTGTRKLSRAGVSTISKHQAKEIINNAINVDASSSAPNEGGGEEEEEGVLTYSVGPMCEKRPYVAYFTSKSEEAIQEWYHILQRTITNLRMVAVASRAAEVSMLSTRNLQTRLDTLAVFERALLNCKWPDGCVIRQEFQASIDTMRRVTNALEDEMNEKAKEEAIRRSVKLDVELIRQYIPEEASPVPPPKRAFHLVEDAETEFDEELEEMKFEEELARLEAELAMSFQSETQDSLESEDMQPAEGGQLSTQMGSTKEAEKAVHSSLDTELLTLPMAVSSPKVRAKRARIAAQKRRLAELEEMEQQLKLREEKIDAEEKHLEAFRLRVPLKPLPQTPTRMRKVKQGGSPEVDDT